MNTRFLNLIFKHRNVSIAFFIDDRNELKKWGWLHWWQKLNWRQKGDFIDDRKVFLSLVHVSKWMLQPSNRRNHKIKDGSSLFIVIVIKNYNPMRHISFIKNPKQNQIGTHWKRFMPSLFRIPESGCVYCSYRNIILGDTRYYPRIFTFCEGFSHLSVFPNAI